MLSALQELKLIARCVTLDDRDAFGQLVVAYQDPLRRFLLNLTLGNAALTDDLSQETFLKAWISIRQFKGISKFKTWLFKIAVNEFIRWKRSNCNREEIEFKEIDGFEYNSLTYVDAQHDLAVAMEDLNDKERAVTLLFYLEGMPIKQIHIITGIPEGSIKSYLSRSREKIVKLLKND